MIKKKITCVKMRKLKKITCVKMKKLKKITCVKMKKLKNNIWQDEKLENK